MLNCKVIDFYINYKLIKRLSSLFPHHGFLHEYAFAKGTSISFLLGLFRHNLISKFDFKSLMQYYKNPDKTKRDFQNLLQHYRGLQLKVDTFGMMHVSCGLATLDYILFNYFLF